MPPPVPPVVLGAPPNGRVLVLAAHPDDESLGCGGILALHNRQGNPIKVIFVTSGMTGDPQGYYRGLDYRELRRNEARKATRVLGIEALEFWDYPDGKLPEASDLSVRLLALLRREKPDIVYRPSLDEIHPDHWALASAFAEASQQYEWSLMDYCYEVWGTVQPTHVIDISPVWERKAKAIGQYESQLRYNDYFHVFSGLSAYRTLFLYTAKHAEAYQEAKRR